MPLAIGAVAMLAAFGPAWLSAIVAIVGAFIAGRLNPNEPVRAGLLTVALPAVGGLVRVLVDDESKLGVLAVAIVAGSVLAVVASYVGAGVQRRRLATPLPSRDA